MTMEAEEKNKIIKLGKFLETYFPVRFRGSSHVSMVNLNLVHDFLVEHYHRNETKLVDMLRVGLMRMLLENVSAEIFALAFRNAFPWIKVVQCHCNDGTNLFLAIGMKPLDEVREPLTIEQWKEEFTSITNDRSVCNSDIKNDKNQIAHGKVSHVQEKNLTVTEIINEYGKDYHIKKSTWYAFIKNGKLKSRKVQGKILVKESDLRAFLEERVK